MAPGLVPSPRHLQRTSSPARISDWEREEGSLRPWPPASCRRPDIFGGRHLLLASLTVSERRGDSVYGARPADDHSAFSCAKDPASPTRRGLAIWRCHFRHGPEGGGDQLPICSARSIVASVSAGQQGGKYTIINDCY